MRIKVKSPTLGRPDSVEKRAGAPKKGFLSESKFYRKSLNKEKMKEFFTSDEFSHD